ncbi:GNAT family N-acetyltransferase [Rhodococcus fascians]|uniref:GNAT family N-acetyltransferase n=2 Tax=Mycobacteriales TaxID=85007 RepID=UPI001C924633|nr:GNAT family N-acetyltransferase [Rhodococcus fascians]MBX5333803.1 GNAT family N-acetyltransferase [Rhodococcus fascians]MBY4036758.1 GNAT family N-acetyltransferase [Rhodococcus fascians]MBY4059979.1 GNAT family N-acetyltransferase [Rhodococcus fascians]MBY4070237.1 GNAT family N-acetyltransferase [Rhodococcus fascians]MBY4141040.1 GNAT family N-acetyltransferase [Rhodococcus fascians]
MAGIEIAQVDPSTDRLSAEKILAVQRSAYAVEAELIGDDRIPLLHESVDDLCAAQVHWLVALDLDEILGAAAWSGSEIDRLVVAPHAHRQGIGRGLVTAALNCIAGERVLVATGRDNAPARRLYESLGFVHSQNQEVLPGLWLARYELNRSEPRRLQR